MYDNERDYEIDKAMAENGGQFPGCDPLDDDGYREWSETIEKQTLDQQILDDYNRADSLITLDELNAMTADEITANVVQVIDLSHLSWSEVMDKFLGGK